MSVPDYALESTLDFKFTTRAFATGIPTTLGGTPVVQVYEDNSVTQITAGITLSADFDSVAGLNNLRIAATAANGYEAGKSYAAVISTGTVSGVSVVGEVVQQFSIQRAPVNWANVTAPTTAVDLSATDIQLCDTTTTNTDMVGTDNAALAATALSTVTWTGARAGYLDNINGHTAQTGDNYARIGAGGASLTAINLPNQTMDITGSLSGSVGSVGGNVTGSVGSVVGHTAQTGDTYALANGAAGFVAIDTVVDAVKVVTDALGSSGAASLALSAAGIISGTAATGTLSTTVMTSDLSGYLDDELIGRAVIWTGGDADGQASDVTDYAAASGTVTYTAITTAPANGDTFVIV